MSRLGRLLLPFASTACGPLLGAEDYQSVETKPSLYQGLLDFMPPDCAACSKTACDGAVLACLDEAPCEALARCISTSENPGVRELCYLEHAAGKKAFQKAAGCLMSSCSPSCVSPRRFACSGTGFDWPTPAEPRFDYAVRFTDVSPGDPPLPGLGVRACQRMDWQDPSCKLGKQAEGTTDADGRVELADIGFATVATREPWDGYLDVSGPGVFPEIRLHSRPVLGDMDETMSSLMLLTMAVYLDTYELQLEPGHGILTVDVLDCFGFRASGVSLELEPPSPGSVTLYSTGGFAFSKTATATGADGVAVFVNVPAGTRLLRARDEATGSAVSLFPVHVRAGSRTGVFLDPTPLTSP